MVTVTNRTLNGVVIKVGTFVPVTTTFTAAETWPAGSVLGRITSTDKYVRFNPANSDGSEVPSAVLTQDLTSTAAGDLAASVAGDGEFRLEKLVDALDVALLPQAVFDLRTYSIFALSTRNLTIQDNQ